MKNWKTTVIGFCLAVAVAIQPYATTGVFEWKQMIIPALIAGLSYFIKDKDSTEK